MSPIMKLIELYMSLWYWVYPLDEILAYIRVNWFQRLAAAKKVHWWLWGFNLIWWINLFAIIGLQFNWGYIWPLNDCGFMASYRRVGSLEPLFLWPLNDWELHNVEDFFFFQGCKEWRQIWLGMGEDKVVWMRGNQFPFQCVLFGILGCLM